MAKKCQLFLTFYLSKWIPKVVCFMSSVQGQGKHLRVSHETCRQNLILSVNHPPWLVIIIILAHHWAHHWESAVLRHCLVSSHPAESKRLCSPSFAVTSNNTGENLREKSLGHDKAGKGLPGPVVRQASVPISPVFSDVTGGKAQKSKTKQRVRNVKH